jgi:hypothetical protein
MACERRHPRSVSLTRLCVDLLAVAAQELDDGVTTHVGCNVETVPASLTRWSSRALSDTVTVSISRRICLADDALQPHRLKTFTFSAAGFRSVSFSPRVRTTRTAQADAKIYDFVGLYCAHSQPVALGLTALFSHAADRL